MASFNQGGSGKKALPSAVTERSHPGYWSLPELKRLLNVVISVQNRGAIPSPIRIGFSPSEQFEMRWRDIGAAVEETRLLKRGTP